MDQTQKRIHDIIAGNIGNRLTQELANGMFASLLTEFEALKALASAPPAAQSTGKGSRAQATVQ